MFPNSSRFILPKANSWYGYSLPTDTKPYSRFSDLETKYSPFKVKHFVNFKFVFWHLTSFWRHLWPQTKMHTTLNSIFKNSFFMLFYMVLFICSECYPKKHLPQWLKFFNSQSKTSILRFLKLTLQTKWITPCERAWKNVLENGVGNCVHFCLRPLEPLERCVLLKKGL